MTETPSKPDVPIIPPAEESVEKRKDHIREYVKEKLANGVRDAAPYVKLLYGDLWLYNELKKQSYDVERYNGMNTIWFDHNIRFFHFKFSSFLFSVIFVTSFALKRVC